MKDTTIITLASGSKANCTWVSYKNTALLVDCGLSYRGMCCALSDVGASDRLDGVLVTHEHEDHISGIATLCSKTAVPIYTHPDTWAAYTAKHAIRNDNHVEMPYYDSGDGFAVGSILVKPFRVSHDTAYPVAYTLTCGDMRVAIITDTGCITPGIIRNIADVDVLMIESNHDEKMLRNGPYPLKTQNRILSKLGHLSNATTARYLEEEKMRDTRLKKIVLMHISQNNNTAEIALNATAQVLRRAGREDIVLCAADQNTPLSVW